MDIDDQLSNNKFTLQPTNALAGPSTITPDLPALFLPPPVPPRPKPYFKSTDDLLSRFQLSQAYERYVRPFALPQDTTTAITPLGAIDKGKGKEKELPMREMVPPPGGTPAPPPNEAEDDDHQPGGKGERKWKNSYKHMIKTIPGKHSMKKDDYLMTMMQVPPKQQSTITQFDLRTQRDAFSVSLEGLKGWNINALVAETPQAREDRKRRKELKKLAKAQALAQLASGASPLSAHPATPSVGTPGTSGHPPVPLPNRTTTPRPGSGPPNRAPQTAQQPQPPSSTTQNPSSSQIRSRTPVGVGTPRSASTPGLSQYSSSGVGTSHFGLSNSAPGQLNQVSTPAPTPNAGPDVSVGGKRGMKREREDGGGGGGPVVVNGNAGFSMPGGPVNGGMKSHHVGVSAKTASGVGSNGVRPRPVKKQRMDSQGQAREVPVQQQPTPHA